MSRGKRYDIGRVDIRPLDARRATWEWGRKSVTGREFIYEAIDRNFDRLNRWTFIVQVPRNRKERVIVRPREFPPKAAWAGIDRRSIVFARASKNPFRKKLYCKVTLSDPLGGQTKFVARRQERKFLPRWTIKLQPRMRLKRTVASTRGRDGDQYLLLIAPDDHARMIRVFFALKVWVLQEGFTFV